jgi:hypothetical protein
MKHAQEGTMWWKLMEERILEREKLPFSVGFII